MWQLKTQLGEMALKLQSELGKTDARKKEVRHPGAPYSR
jgi:hypothetical protein